MRALPIALLSIAGSLAGCGARTSLPAPEPSPPEPVCGDHIAFSDEACDDGNTSNTDACVEGCELATCGDGFVRASFEACDDGNTDNLDGCRSNCALPTCGDGVLDLGEECDDANGVDSDGCPALCLFARCGDGFVQAGVEECDAGAANADIPAFLLTQGELSRGILPVGRSMHIAVFYDYQSASSHTGFEAVGESRLYLYRDLVSGVLSLVTHHGIDIDASGLDQPKSEVVQSFLNLPPDSFVAISDDTDGELSKDSPTSARGNWKFHHNTDGGALSGLPSPGSWSIDIVPEFDEGIGSWAYVDTAGDVVSLETTATANITAFPAPGPCRLDCTLARCGDGIVDGGEVCDDGNTGGGDGCAADCKSN
jgi:cysteine-rich repeat protein